MATEGYRALLLRRPTNIEGAVDGVGVLQPSVPWLGGEQQLIRRVKYVRIGELLKVAGGVCTLGQGTRAGWRAGKDVITIVVQLLLSACRICSCELSQPPQAEA